MLTFVIEWVMGVTMYLAAGGGLARVVDNPGLDWGRRGLTGAAMVLAWPVILFVMLLIALVMGD